MQNNRVLILAGLLSATLPALAAEVYIARPTDGTHRIDICLHWGMECAGEAADVFCKAKGYDGALGFEVDDDIGGAEPTVVIGTGQVCAEPHCDGYFSITCAREDDWTRGTGNGGLLVEVIRADSKPSAAGALLVAVSETDERVAASVFVDQYNLGLLHTAPGKYRLFIENWKNTDPVMPLPGATVDVMPGKEGAYLVLQPD